MDEQWTLAHLCSLPVDIYGITADNNGNLFYVFSPETYAAHRKIAYLHTLNTQRPNEASMELVKKNKAMFCGIAWNSKNNTLYVSECAQQNVLSYSIDTKELIAFAGKDGLIKTELFFTPSAVVVDNNGDIYVSDVQKIIKIHLSEQVVTCIQLSNNQPTDWQMYRPNGLSVSPDGTIYFADYSEHTIRSIKDGVTQVIAGTPNVRSFHNGSLEQSTFSWPRNCCFDLHGNLLITESNSSIRKLSFKHHTVSSVLKPSHVSGLCYLCMDHKGVLYVASNNSLYKVVNTWAEERFLWLASLKEDPQYCPLASLPRDIIKQIALLLFMQQVDHE